MATVRIWGQIYLEESPRARLLSLILNPFSALTQTDVVADVHGHHALLGFLWVMSWTSLPLVPLKACKAVRMAWLDLDVFSFLFSLFIELTYHGGRHFKAYNAVVFSLFRDRHNHDQLSGTRTFPHPTKEALCPLVSPHTTSPPLNSTQPHPPQSP